ncbi:sugar phosphate isomerase/epimerase family protein [Verrucomicrobiota bacterium sgz303538]
MQPIPRRRFLQQTAATLATLVLPLSTRAAQSGISLGFSLYGMKTVPLNDALRACAHIGYRNVELALNAGYPTEPKVLSTEQRTALRGQLHALKLDPSALMLNLSLVVNDAIHSQHLESLKAAAELAHDLAPENPPIIETVLGGKPAEWNSLKAQMADRLRSWAETAANSKVVVALKAHVGSAVNSPDRLLWLLQQVNSPAIKVAYDYSHFELADIPLAESLKALLPHTRFIHVKDTLGDPQKFQFLLPGEGRTDYEAYFQLLQEAGYRGPVVVEVSAQVFNKPGYDPVAAAEKCYAALTNALHKAGVSQG